MNTVGRTLATVGAVQLLVGLVLGFVPQSADGIRCGNAFAASESRSDQLREDPGAMTPCDDKRHNYLIVAVTLSIVGGALALGGGLLLLASSENQRLDRLVEAEPSRGRRARPS